MKEKEKNAKDDGFVEEVTLGEIHPLQLSSGGTLSPFKIAYKSWGKLNSDKSNAILVCHALTGDQYARGKSQLIQMIHNHKEHEFKRTFTAT